MHQMKKAFAFLLAGACIIASAGKYPAITVEKDASGNVSLSSFDAIRAKTMGSGVTARMFEASSLDNTWLFGGGAETQGRFSEIGGVRNYIGQFEEYIRWNKRVDSVLYGLQRYTINVGKVGLDASSFAKELEEDISRIQPMAVAYLIGPEDYRQGEDGIEKFKTAISSILELALAMKEDNGCVVLQLPHAVKDSQMASEAARYANAAIEAAEAIEEDGKRERIAIVNHLEQTNNDDFIDTMLTEDGLLNARGHYEMAKQLAASVYGSSDGFPEISGSWTPVFSANCYENDTPIATGLENGLQIAMPDNDEETAWNYVLTIEDEKISGAAYGNPFTIQDLPADKPYRLTLRTKNGSLQYAPVEGTISKGSLSKEAKPSEYPQKAIRDAADLSKESLTWLFMGDSITHAAAHTHGYDGIAQIFEKYLKEDLGRTNDIVINTGVSGATTLRTLENIEQRMTKYKPDIVSLMIGTNDSRELQTADYRANLKEIIDHIKEVNPDALIILRSPTPATGWNGTDKYPGENGYVAAMKSLADEDENILFIDQYTEWNQECVAYPYFYSAGYYYGDGYLHPGAAGQLKMAQQFIRECGLNANTKIAELSYQFSYEKEESSILPDVAVSADKTSASISRTALNEAYTNGEIGEITVTVTDSAGRTYEKSSGLENDDVTFQLPSDQRYTIDVTANIKGSTAKLVSFAAQDVLLSGLLETDSDIQAADAVSAKIDAISSMEDIFEHLQEIENARAAYDALSKIQKLLVPNASIKILTDAEMSISQQAASEAMKKIKILTSFTNIVEHKQELENARSAYQALTDMQKKLIPNSVLKILTDAEAEYDRLTYQPDNPGAQPPDNSGSQTPGNSGSQTTDNPPSTEENIYSNKGYLYKITNAKQKTAELVSGPKSASNIKVPASVKLNGTSCKVTSIASAAFKNNKKATSASIGKNVESIGANAFAGCSKLKTASLNSTALKQIGNKAFFQCKALKKITIKSNRLKKVGQNAWKGIHKNAVITVPSSKLKPYQKLFSKKGQGKNVKIKK